MIELSRKKLELFGLTSNQVEEIKNSGKINLTVTYYSPISGTAIEKKVQEGMYVNEGTAIYEVAELSTLWNIAEVNETDLANIKVGSSVKLKLNAYPGEEFSGKVIFIYPVVNPQTRTVKVRSKFSSYNNKLKSQMYGQTFFNSDDGTGLVVPSDAIMFSGKRNVVWVKTADKMFEVRNVQVGQKYGDKYQILSGLNEGDEVAVTGGYLIDSESQLKNGMASEDKNIKDNSSETQNNELETNSLKHNNH
ncbi:MAG: efflux RND transporter periplasmic adaptor subunit [Ignavibacteriaceae bacterium]